MSTGYKHKAGIYVYPRRALYSGVPNSLTLILKAPNLTSEDNACKMGMRGYKVNEPNKIWIIFKKLISSGVIA